jgi:transposase-like protein
MRFPVTIFEFQEQFPTEEACWQHLRRVRWPRGFRCPRCGHDRGYFLERRRLEQCRACRYQASVTAGTIFHRTRLPLRVWFVAIFFVARHKQGISALQLQRDTGIGSYETAWTLLHKVRSALFPDPSRRLTGLVEADESYVGAPHERGKRGGREIGRKVLVGVAVENRGQTAGAARLAVLGGMTFENDVGPFVRGMIDAAEAVVRTDGFRSYQPLRKVGVRHHRRVQGQRSRSSKILPWSHVLFSNLKSWLRGTFHGVSKKHMPRYLDEFTYRLNQRWDEIALFGSILSRSLVSPPLPYARLVADSGR